MLKISAILNANHAAPLQAIQLQFYCFELLRCKCAAFRQRIPARKSSNFSEMKKACQRSKRVSWGGASSLDSWQLP